MSHWHIAEKSSIEERDFPLGKGKFIRVPTTHYPEGVFGEVSLDSPFILRIHKTDGRFPYSGVLQSPVEASDQAYKIFYNWTEQLAILTGRKIPNTMDDYITYLVNGLNLKLSGAYIVDSVSIRINPQDRVNFPQYPEFFERFNKDIFQQPGFLLDKYVREFSQLQILKTFEKIKKYAQVKKQLDKTLDLLEELFTKSHSRQGIIVDIERSTLEEVVDAMSFVLGKTQKEIQEIEKKVEDKKPESSIANIPNLWDIDIPKIENIVGGMKDDSFL